MEMGDVLIETKSNTIGRVVLVFVLSVVIWRVTLLLFDGHQFADRVLLHIVAGLFLSALICALMIFMMRTAGGAKDASWKKAAPGHLKALGLGFLCWIIPAAVSICVFIVSGMVIITAQTEYSALIVPFFALLVAVFFIEAFPEELVRGYLYSRLEVAFSPWTALLAQTVLFTLFASLIGSLHSTEQWLFIPGFGFLLGYFRMLSGSVWFAMGFHCAMMTATQFISPLRQLLEVDGSFFVVRFLCFLLIPAIVSSLVLHFKTSYIKE